MKRSKPTKSLSSTIYRLRTKFGLNQRDFASKLGVSAMAVSRWEVGANQPPADCLVTMAKMADDPEVFWMLLGQLGLTKRDMKVK